MERVKDSSSLLDVDKNNTVLKLEKLYNQQVKEKNLMMIRSQIYQDLQTLGYINDSEIAKLVDHALEIIRKANQLQRKGNGLTNFVDSEMLKNDFAKPEDFMKIRLNFYNRYGEMGKQVRDKIVKEKWDKLK